MQGRVLVGKVMMDIQSDDASSNGNVSANGSTEGVVD